MEVFLKSNYIGLLAAGLNAATLALIDAGIPMTDYLTACSIGVGNDLLLLDLNYTEEATEAPVVTVAVLAQSGKMTMCNLECRLPMDSLEEILELGKDACLQIYTLMDKIIRENA